MPEIMEPDDEQPSTSQIKKTSKPPKYGIIYLSTVPPYMNVLKIKQFFSDFGKVGRVYLQLNTAILKGDKSKKYKARQRFSEGWVEFERKSVAKRVAQMLNNTQVDTRKKSKQYDSMWNMKYLSNFKWTHLTARLVYERLANAKKLQEGIQQVKKKAETFSGNVDKKKRKSGVNKEWENLNEEAEEAQEDDEGKNVEEKREFLQNLFT